MIILLKLGAIGYPFRVDALNGIECLLSLQ